MAEGHGMSVTEAIRLRTVGPQARNHSSVTASVGGGGANPNLTSSAYTEK